MKVTATRPSLEVLDRVMEWLGFVPERFSVAGDCVDAPTKCYIGRYETREEAQATLRKYRDAVDPPFDSYRIQTYWDAGDLALESLLLRALMRDVQIQLFTNGRFWTAVARTNVCMHTAKSTHSPTDAVLLAIELVRKQYDESAKVTVVDVGSHRLTLKAKLQCTNPDCKQGYIKTNDYENGVRCSVCAAHD